MKSNIKELTEIEGILFNTGTDELYYSKEEIYDFLKQDESLTIVVNIPPFPKLEPVLKNGIKYVKSEPDNTGVDNLLQLPQI